MGGLSPVAGLTPLMRSLVREANGYPIDRKVVVSVRRGTGRELLRRLALVRGGWTQFEVLTPRALSMDLVADALVERGLSVADEFDELELIDEAIEAATRDRPETLAPFISGTGLREAMANSIRALRLAGIDAATLGRAGFRDRTKREAVGRVLDHYERGLLASRRTDLAGVLRLAVGALEAGAVALPIARYLMLPGQSRRGLTGRLLDLLADRGAVMLPTDRVAGLSIPPSVNDADTAAGATMPPDPSTATSLAWLHAVESAPADAGRIDLEIFSAGSVNDEIREVLRRCVERGLRWDDVEIVTTDPMAYGTALDAVSRRLGIPVTYASGLPLGRTRAGRVVDSFLRWVRDGFPEDVIRELIERGDIAPRSATNTRSGPALARRLRRMLIGKGRERYEAAIDRAERALQDREQPEYPQSAAEAEDAHRTERALIDGLREMFSRILAPLPHIVGAGRESEARVSPAQIASSLIECLSLVPVDSGLDATTSTSVDVTAIDRLTRRLARLAETARRAMPLESAIAVIASKLDTRVPAPAAAGVAPWTSTGGRLHLSDVDHGGWTGRSATFIVGLDAGRFPGTTLHDTLLDDDDRRRLALGAGYAALPTTGERVEERRYALASLLARLRGRVTLSYAAWEAAEARTVAPAPELLQAFRLLRRDPALDYAKLHSEAFLQHASAIPRAGAHLDDADAWLGALSRDGVLVSGVDAVREAYPGLDRGLRARDARASAEFTPHHGRLEPRADLDPRDHPVLVLSPDRLETLGACPHRYMLRHVLDVRPLDDQEFAPDRWLSAADRGRLLHRVYRDALSRAGRAEDNVADEAFDRHAFHALEEQIDWMRERLAPPGEAVFDLECEALRDEVSLFVTMTRARGAPWRALEQQFGSDFGGRAAVRIELPGGGIALRGRIDRVDEVGGELVVIDYKTGRSDQYGRREGVFNGGRRLQHALYAAAARRLFDAPVARSEYHFPTHRGEARVASYDERMLRRARRIVNALLDIVAAGTFFPTDDAEDCRWCDYREVCRVRDAGRSAASPMADWSRNARERRTELRVFAALRDEAG